MNALRWLTKEIKEEWSDIASKRMKRFILFISGCLLVTYILTLFHLTIIAIPFITALIVYGGYEVRKLEGLEGWIAIIIYLACLPMLLLLEKIQYIIK